jgi:hypothetical protein
MRIVLAERGCTLTWVPSCMVFFTFLKYKPWQELRCQSLNRKTNTQVWSAHRTWTPNNLVWENQFILYLPLDSNWNKFSQIHIPITKFPRSHFNIIPQPSFTHFSLPYLISLTVLCEEYVLWTLSVT